MTPAEFKEARHSLGLTVSALGALLDTDSRTIRRWEAAPHVPTGRPPNPIAARVLAYFVARGGVPGDWPT